MNRIALKQVRYYLQMASQACEIIEQEQTPLAMLITKALDECEDVTESTRIRCGDKEPLNYMEESIYERLARELKMTEECLSSATPEQRFSAARVIARQGLPMDACWDTETLMIVFPHIVIGIEKDGYAHS